MAPGEGEKNTMEKRMFKVEERFCDECALALRKFIRHMDGVESIDVENKIIAVVFDSAKMSEKRLSKIAADSLEKLSHKLIV
jgi:copper chaperone CopZ